MEPQDGPKSSLIPNKTDSYQLEVTIYDLKLGIPYKRGDRFQSVPLCEFKPAATYGKLHSPFAFTKSRGFAPALPLSKPFTLP